MNWASWSDFWNMGGYGLYVWGSYALTALCMVGEIFLARGRFGSVVRRLARNRYAAVKGVGNETET